MVLRQIRRCQLVSGAPEGVDTALQAHQRLGEQEDMEMVMVLVFRNLTKEAPGMLGGVGGNDRGVAETLDIEVHLDISEAVSAGLCPQAYG